MIEAEQTELEFCRLLQDLQEVEPVFANPFFVTVKLHRRELFQFGGHFVCRKVTQVRKVVILRQLHGGS